MTVTICGNQDVSRRFTDLVEKTVYKVKFIKIPFFVIHIESDQKIFQLGGALVKLKSLSLHVIF